MMNDDMMAYGTAPRTLGLLLVNQFALMAYASVVEAYRAANALSGRTLYRWSHVSVDGGPCQASNGATILPDLAVGDPFACDALFVFAGGDPTLFDDADTFGWLRQMAARGAVMIGVSGGAYVLARAGLLENRRATVHWEYREAFVEAFPSTICEPGLFVFDGRRVTCAGGMAGMDLAIELIERDHGHALAVAVSDWFIRPEARLADRPQRQSLSERYGVSNQRVLRALAEMEGRIEEPVSRQRLAAVAGVGIRQLERLFRAETGNGLRETYLRVRLAHAERLLRNTGLNMTAIAFACGFANTSHFSRSYRQHFGRPPSHERVRRQTGAGKP
ncbi:GlxA family transcriptional regulator [uncultured Sphingomonas sp.]|uniref:GlxA family transcriptional regulator n=1 Tax=uncultured Sphingomonas sp. TaxID=158754 RepID=UPI000A460B17|nr:GlxA family transcriptional regulator [uncultured Sphingomonas sp.]